MKQAITAGTMIVMTRPRGAGYQRRADDAVDDADHIGDNHVIGGPGDAVPVVIGRTGAG